MNKIKFFETKEQYLNFRKAFATAVNDPRAKKGKPDTNGYKARGWMTGAHFMLLNAIRGLPIERGFSPITAELKIENGAIADGAIQANRIQLESMIMSAKAYIEAKPADMSNAWRWKKGTTQEEANKQQQDKYRTLAESFLLPFAGYLTIADLARVEIK